MGNDFAMAHELTVRPCEDAVYLPKRTHGRAPTVHHPHSHRCEGGNGGNPSSPGCGVGKAGTTHCHTGKGDRSYSQGPRDGDD